MKFYFYELMTNIVLISKIKKTFGIVLAKVAKSSQFSSSCYHHHKSVKTFKIPDIHPSSLNTRLSQEGRSAHYRNCVKPNTSLTEKVFL